MSSDTRDLRVEVRVKNNVLWKKIHKVSGSVAEFVRDHPEVGDPMAVFRLVALKRSPVRKDGHWTPAATRLAEVLATPEAELFPGWLYIDGPKKLRVLEVSKKELLFRCGNTGLVAAPEEEQPERVLEELELHRRVNRVLQTLKPREETILRMRFGIGMDPDHTLEEVGAEFYLSRGRIQQIETRALKKLRHPSRSRQLRSFVDPSYEPPEPEAETE